ncbi:CYTH and CHAD domain-containing protein [Streptomyces sp. NPDC003077]|uniref:CYTH and CHAD domain-containing protein n=1 Tax=Streptomyces sp. NPDC003077 TaxID=3154443 RepID=UPI0033A6378D
MADTVREIERKYEATAGARLPDLTAVPGVADVVDQAAVDLDATYYDTADQRLAADGITLRRRTGGDDAGWHLKLPVGPSVREEIRAPLGDELPRSLAGLVRSRVRGAELRPVVRLRSRREVRQLMGTQGELLAEVGIDAVRAERCGDGRAKGVTWTEIEAELSEGATPGLLDAIDGCLRAGGLRPSSAPSKLARALAETAPGEGGEDGAGRRRGKGGKGGKRAGRVRGVTRTGAVPGSGPGSGKGRAAAPETAGDVVMGYVRTQVRALVELDPAARRDQPDAVHRMRVATRRLRSAFRSYARVLDRAVTDPLGDELKWLAGELGVDRDREVLTARLQEGLAGLPRALHLGPVRTRLRTWSAARRTGSRRHLIAVLDGARYLALLEALVALAAAPPLRGAARRAPGALLPKVVERDFGRLAARMSTALAEPAGPRRDVAMHEARKAAKRTRYAAEAARPALGAPAKKFAARMTAVQELLGDHQDSVVAREALRDIAVQAHSAGESGFTFGLLYGREEAVAATRERELPELWEDVARPEHRAALRG